MTDYTKLVKALRLCQFGECGCGKCYYKELKGDWCTEDNHPEFFDCDDKLKLDAANAIEALNRLVDLNTERCEGLRKQLREAQEQYEKNINELEKELSFSESTYEEYQIVAATQNALLAKQLPKRGEWQKAKPKGVVTYSDGYAECSHCHKAIWLGWWMNFCPHCGTQNKIIDPDDYDGAKMTEVQDGEEN